MKRIFVIVTALLLAFAALPFQQVARTAFANGVALQKGDVLAAVGNSSVKHFTPTGTLRDTLNDSSGSYYTAGMCFDASGNVYVTNFSVGSVSKFNSSGTLVTSSFASGFANPESCVFDKSGNMYVGQAGAGQISKVNSAGMTTATYQVATQYRGTDWIELASDQCTMYYTSEGPSILRYNICSRTQLPAFVTVPNGAACFEVRIRPNGDVMVACSSDAYRISAAGAVLQTYPASQYGDSFFFALNLDPDNSTFWTGDIVNGNIVHANIATGALIKQFNSQPFTVLGGLAIVGEITGAGGGGGGGNTGTPCGTPCSLYVGFSRDYPSGHVSVTASIVKNSDGAFIGGISFTDSRPGGIVMPSCTLAAIANCKLTVASFNCISPTEAIVTGTWTYGGVSHPYTLDVSGTSGGPSTFTLTTTTSTGETYTYTATGSNFAKVTCVVPSGG